MSEFPEPERSGAWRQRAPRHTPFLVSLPASPAIARTGTPDLPVELAAFDGTVDPAILEAAALRAARLGVGGDEVLRCAGILTADQIAACIGRYLGLAIDPLRESFEPRSLAAACAGVLLRRGRNGQSSITVAARGTGIRWLAGRLAAEPDASSRLRIVAPERLAEHVRTVASEQLAQEAVYGLHRRRPDHSAIAYGWAQLQTFTIGLAGAMLTAGVFAPGGLLIALEYFLALCFIGWTLLRLVACLLRQEIKPEFEISDRHLPIYTIIVPLYREAPVVAKLVRALRQLRYPREKLDIKFMIESDDAETLAEIAKLRLTAPFEIIAPPRIGPQTKPRALAAALPFARGSLVTVYDAEDEPEPDQLRDAVAAFASGPPELACVQAKLSIDNPDDGWFSRQFTAEYAGQFDVFLPALAKMKLPIPLGGTSNHFRASALRHAGGWDPYNVTEDADLGMRLARYGYSIGVIHSTTWEEAPVGFAQWLRQRTRWFKGWTQTWIVHMRHPLRLLHELGLRNFMAFQLLVGGTMMSAVVHPFFMLLVLFHATTGELFMPGETAEHSARKLLAICVLGIGYFGAIVLGLTGLKRRGMLRIAWVVFTIPLYWLFMSFAAWRALWQLVRAPYHWEKTPHGLARSSLRRQAENALPRTPNFTPLPRSYAIGKKTSGDQPNPARRFRSESVHAPRQAEVQARKA